MNDEQIEKYFNLRKTDLDKANKYRHMLVPDNYINTCLLMAMGFTIEFQRSSVMSCF